MAAVAQGLMSHYLAAKPSLQHGLLLAYRAIDTTIEVSSAHVGPPVQIAVCDEHGPRILDVTEIDALNTGVARWKEIERESLFIGLEDAQEEAKDDLPVMDAEK